MALRISTDRNEPPDNRSFAAAYLSEVRSFAPVNATCGSDAEQLSESSGACFDTNDPRTGSPKNIRALCACLFGYAFLTLLVSGAVYAWGRVVLHEYLTQCSILVAPPLCGSFPMLTALFLMLIGANQDDSGRYFFRHPAIQICWLSLSGVILVISIPVATYHII